MNPTILPQKIYDMAEEQGIDLTGYVRSETIKTLSEQQEKAVTLHDLYYKGNRKQRRKAQAIFDKMNKNNRYV